MRKRFWTCLGVTLLSSMLLGKSFVFANARPTAQEFPEKTIIIGTYAIVLDVVNEELLEAALQSAEINMQNEVYFKSDVNSGVWYNITNSDSISDISESTANIVKNQEIDQLYLTHYTNASGVTISLLTNKEVYVSDIDTPQLPTNIVELDELENELKIQQALYDSVKDEPEDETEKEEDKRLEKKAIYSQKINSLNRVLSVINNKEIDKLTSQIHAVENLERQLVKNGADSEKIEMVVSQKENLKNTRMAYCYQILIDKMNKENVTIDYEDCNDLIQKYAGAITSLESILSELGVATDKVASDTGEDENVDETFSDNQPDQELVEEEATGVDKIIEESLALMLEYAESGNFAKAEEVLEEAYVAETVKNNDNNVSEEVKEKQKEVLEQAVELLEQQVLELVKSGDGKSYKEAVENKESETVLGALEEERVSELSDLLTQLEETYASLGEKIEDSQEQAKLLQEKIETYENLLKVVPICEVKEGIEQLLQEKLGYTKEQLNEVKLQSIPEYQETVSLVESITKQVESLNEKYLEAIEENEIEDSKQYKAELDEAVEELVNAEDKLEQLEKDFMEGNLKSDLEIEVPFSIEEVKEQEEKILKELEETISKEAGSLEKVLDLLENLDEIEIIKLEQAENLEEAISVMEDDLLDLEQLLQNADSQKEGTNLVEEKITQIKEQIEHLEEYLEFIEETNQNLEKQLDKTTDIFEQKDILADTKETYKEKLEDVNGEENIEEELKDCIIEALQEELSNITKKEQELQKKIDERLAEILGDKSELSEANKKLAQAQEEKYSEDELDEIATLTDSLRDTYAKKDAELLYPWLVIFKDYDVKLTLPAIKIKEEVYVPAEELAVQLGADLLTSKTNDVIVIKGRGVLIEYILNDNVVYVNDKKMTVALPPAKEIQNQVYISLQCFLRAYRLEEATYDDYTILSKK